MNTECRLDTPSELSESTPKKLSAVVFIILLTAVPSSFGAQKKAAAGPGKISSAVEWDQYLIQGEPNPTLKIPVAHQHAATGCYGYLYITRQEIWYEVSSPATDLSHGFRFPRSTLTDARQWRLWGSTLPEVEFKFSNGRTFHFFRVRANVITEMAKGPRKFGWDDVLSWEPLAQATLNFDQTVHLAEERQAALAPKPAPTLSLTVDPPSVERGHEVTLTWTSQNATTLDLEPGVGAVPASGSRTLTPTDSTTYVLTAQGPGGAANTSSQVRVNAPQTPPTLALVDPPATTGQTVEVSASPLTIRGMVMDSSGLAVVTVNGASAGLRPKTPQAAEFTSDPIPLQPGDNRIEVDATNSAQMQAKVIFLARFKPPTPAAAARPANPKGLVKAEILQLLKGDVPSPQVTELVKERGINFTPTEADLEEIRAAGGDDDLIAALRQAQSK